MMEMENETVLTCCSQTQTSSPAPSPGPGSPDLHSTITRPNHHAPRFSTVIPNRIFVGGIDGKINENDLWHFFSQHGAVKEVKIVVDHGGVPKGYGFVTFETQEDAQRILHDADRVCFRDKMLNIGQAVHKQQVGRHAKCFPAPRPNPGMALLGPCATMYLTTPNGYPYTYCNGVAYFPSQDLSTPAQHWPQSMSASPMLLSHPPQPVYQQPACQHYQCIPNHLQWNVPQTPVASNPVMYMQPSEFVYQPMEQPNDGGCVQPAGPALEATIPEQFMDHPVQTAYHQMYAPTPGAMAPIVMHQEPGKEQTFYTVRPGYPHSPVSLKPRYRPYHYANHYKDSIPETPEPADPTAPPTAMTPQVG